MKHTATSEPSTIQAPKLRTEDFERVEFRGPGKIATREAEEAHARSQFETGIGKQRVNIALDPDIVRWFKQKAGGRGYQTLINAALRDTMHEQKLEEVLRRVIREELRPD